MTHRARSIIVSGYLLLCILLGGSAQGLWSNLALQLLGIALIAVSAIAAEPADPETENPPIVYAILGLGGLIVLLQLIPLPALPLSKTPYDSVMTLFAAIPAVALFISARMLRPAPSWLAFAIVAGMACSTALGAVQVAGGSRSWAYLYPDTNTGAVGVFANRNHMGTLLLASIPFATALFVSARTRRGAAQARWVTGIAAMILVIVGIVLNGSLAAIGLALPVVIASAALIPAALRWRAIAVPAAGLGFVGAVAMLATTPISSVVTDPASDTSVASRHEIWSTTNRAIAESFPSGTGLGSFEEVYRQYEDPAEVGRHYVNNAHNDYLQLVLELGAPGLLLIVLFLAWWAAAAVKMWTSPLSTPFGRAATIASAAILTHSIVDYPLRTAAIAAVFAVASALMAQRLRNAEPASSGAPASARHVKIG